MRKYSSCWYQKEELHYLLWWAMLKHNFTLPDDSVLNPYLLKCVPWKRKTTQREFDNIVFLFHTNLEVSGLCDVRDVINLWCSSNKEPLQLVQNSESTWPPSVYYNLMYTLACKMILFIGATWHTHTELTWLHINLSYLRHLPYQGSPFSQKKKNSLDMRLLT